MSLRLQAQPHGRRVVWIMRRIRTRKPGSAASPGGTQPARSAGNVVYLPICPGCGRVHKRPFDGVAVMLDCHDDECVREFRERLERRMRFTEDAMALGLTVIGAAGVAAVVARLWS